MTRLEQLLEFYKEDPEDPFTVYALAMEYEKENIPQALSFYDLLLQKHPEYTGTYYHAARLYTEIGNRERAEEIYKKGLEITRNLQRTKDLQELQGAYQNFLFDED
jgi:tetratricopeptide (TPR) repeat protein